ncbi:hypothetical protein CHARACLAT_026585 [Characodon lateralis]|uniref:Uncharacterized protein n=1 Tax=Characodon lateralis TaxID=208331 RepID=A0ABU7EXG7_9TELE|nr:hypothetical protein [Characodon lateralis]
METQPEPEPAGTAAVIHSHILHREELLNIRESSLGIFFLPSFRKRGLRTPLPSIHLANVRSLTNKMDKLLLLTGKNLDLRDQRFSALPRHG